ncbi:hypothetical protein Tsubulata_037453 [Turnera subulata]|uniref:INO80 complex subunit B-like conserved region domain-containing protein n=1 Tax=Turnera subulata TaxID=218843 RepID=A0A9Q0JRD6_9ROSI|nr:hypothetical protein Tsubulata_037453 [Turnera subulata]
MEEFGLTQFDGIGGAVRKKRSQTSRRPKPESQRISDTHDHSLSSETPPSDYMGKASSDEFGDTNPRRKEFSLNQCMSRGFPAAGAEAEQTHIGNKEDGGLNASYNGCSRRGTMINNKRSSEGVLAPANWKSSKTVKECLDSGSRSMDLYDGTEGETNSSEQLGIVVGALGNESRVKKVKLKVGGPSRTIHADSTGNGGSSKTSRSSDTSRSQQKQSLQMKFEEEHSTLDKRTGLQGVPWKDFSGSGFSLGKESSSMGKTSGKNTSGKPGGRSEPVRKSKRVPKKRVLDGEFDEDDEDDEIRYLEKLKSKLSLGSKEDDEESSVKLRNLSTMENAVPTRLLKDGKKSRSVQSLKGKDYKEEEELLSDSELEGTEKRQRKESVDLSIDCKREVALTSRQRALQSSKDGASAAANFIEFPNGLPPAPSRKQKEKLTEVEQQAKKAEAAQRRRMQVEKAAKESEAEAIRKILGQDSSRKKREEKIKKRQEEMAQERAANALTLPPNTIRCVSGPSGTVMTFSEDMGLPSVLNSKPTSYPPPREECAGPDCTTPYRYRDPKSGLPLCSLKCYKAVREEIDSKPSSS